MLTSSCLVLATYQDSDRYFQDSYESLQDGYQDNQGHGEYNDDDHHVKKQSRYTVLKNLIFALLFLLFGVPIMFIVIGFFVVILGFQATANRPALGLGSLQLASGASFPFGRRKKRNLFWAPGNMMTSIPKDVDQWINKHW